MHPTENAKKCWLDGLALSQDRDEKENYQTSTLQG
jgi:hypothetical protein